MTSNSSSPNTEVYSTHQHPLNQLPPFRILIVGAGLGGLAVAISIIHFHRSVGRVPPHITIVEQAHQLSEVGAGIQIPPNSSRVLSSWGLREKLESVSVRPKRFLLRRWTSGEVMGGYHGLVGEKGDGDWDGEERYGGVEEDFGGPYWHIHRADFHRVLVERVTELGVQIKLGHSVQHITMAPTTPHPTIYLTNGNTLFADLIIGADGLKSRCREVVLGRPDKPHNTGDLAYRILVRKEDMERYEKERESRGDTESVGLDELLKEPAINFWMGPRAHAVCYLLKSSSLYNIVLLCPDTLPPDTNIAPADLNEMRELFKNWDPRLRALLDIACHPPSPSSACLGPTSTTEIFPQPPTPPPSPKCPPYTPTLKVQKWRLQTIKPLRTWTISSPSGHITLLGDACHATLPYLAQGAAMAIEDAHVLGLLLSKVTNSKHQLARVLELYEFLRKTRTEWVVRESDSMRGVLHMEDGERQRGRDEMMKNWERRRVEEGRKGRDEDAGRGFCNRWADGGFREFLFGYKGEEEVERAWGEWGEWMVARVEG